MSTAPSDVIQGALKILNLPDLACYQSYEEAIQAIVNNIAVELPAGSLTNVVVGNSEPLDSQRDSVWFRRDNAGVFIGIYVFSSGQWVQIEPVPLPLVEFKWVFGNTSDIPFGYARADDYPALTAPQIAYLQAMWLSDGSGGYDIFQVYWTG